MFYTCLSFCSQGVCVTQCMLGYHTPHTPPPPQKHTPPLEAHPPESTHSPGSTHTPQEAHPPGSTPPPGKHPPGRRLPVRTVRILLECILVFEFFTLKGSGDEKTSFSHPLRLCETFTTSNIHLIYFLS